MSDFDVFRLVLTGKPVGLRVGLSYRWGTGCWRDTRGFTRADAYAKLITDITKDFSPYDAPKDAIYEMKELKMGNNTSIEEHVSKFKMLVTQLKLAKNDAVTEYFRESLPIALQKNVMSLAEPPTTLDDWYKWAIKLHNNFIRMRSAIAKAQGKTGTSNSILTKKTHEREPRRFYFELKQRERDPMAMDIGYMSTEERNELMRRGACFICKMIRHLSRDCPQKKKKLYTPPQNAPQKMKGKELSAHI